MTRRFLWALTALLTRATGHLSFYFEWPEDVGLTAGEELGPAEQAKEKNSDAEHALDSRNVDRSHGGVAVHLPNALGGLVLEVVTLAGSLMHELARTGDLDALLHPGVGL